MKNLDILRAQVAELKRSRSPQAKALAVQLEAAIASLAAGKPATTQLLASVRAALNATSATLDPQSAEGQEATAALARAEAATKALPRDEKGLAGFTRALKEATAATKKAKEKKAAPAASFKIRPGTRR